MPPAKDREKIDLTEVTLCTIDCALPNLARKALRTSLNGCRFADAILFTDTPQESQGQIRTVVIDKITSLDAYSRFVMQSLVHHIETDFVLIVQWDGFVVYPSAWDPDFLRYDYIGAPWPWHKDGGKVGNGGFSLRSRKLLETVAESIAPQNGVPEDELICRFYRDALVENAGIRFAPEDVATKFSYERGEVPSQTFGFHGLYNMWRYLDDAAMTDIVRSLEAAQIARLEYLDLLVYCLLAKRTQIAGVIYRRLRTMQTPQDIKARLLEQKNDPRVVDNVVDMCENRLMV